MLLFIFFSREWYNPHLSQVTKILPLIDLETFKAPCSGYWRLHSDPFLGLPSTLHIPWSLWLIAVQLTFQTTFSLSLRLSTSLFMLRTLKFIFQFSFTHSLTPSIPCHQLMVLNWKHSQNYLFTSRKHHKCTWPSDILQHYVCCLSHWVSPV